MRKNYSKANFLSSKKVFPRNFVLSFISLEYRIQIWIQMEYQLRIQAKAMQIQVQFRSESFTVHGLYRDCSHQIFGAFLARMERSGHAKEPQLVF